MGLEDSGLAGSALQVVLSSLRWPERRGPSRMSGNGRGTKRERGSASSLRKGWIEEFSPLFKSQKRPLISLA